MNYMSRGGELVELKEIQKKLDIVRGEGAKIVVGLEDVMDTLLVALLSDGHVLLEGIQEWGRQPWLRLLLKLLVENLKGFR